MKFATEIFLAIMLLASVAAQDLSVLHKSFIEKYDAINTKRDQKIEALSSGYIQALERLQKKLQANGDLEPVLLVQEEIECIKNAENPLPDLSEKSPVDLKKMRATFVDETEKNLKVHAEALVPLADKMQLLLTEQTKELTKAGKLDEAQVAKKMFDTLQADAALSEARNLLAKTTTAIGGWVNLWEMREKWLIKEPKAWEDFQQYALPKFEVKDLKKKECIFAHATSSFEYQIDPRSTKVSCSVGLSDRGSVSFVILADDKEIYRKSFTGTMLKPQEIEASFANAKKLVFITESNGEIGADQAVWIRPRVK